jgi:hypothetical protein
MADVFKACEAGGAYTCSIFPLWRFVFRFDFQEKIAEIDYRNEWHIFIFNRLKKKTTIIYDNIMT